MEVNIRALSGRITVTVRDDGVGCPSEVNSGLGTRLISLLTSQMNGNMARVPLPRFCEVQVMVSVLPT